MPVQKSFFALIPILFFSISLLTSCVMTSDLVKPSPGPNDIVPVAIDTANHAYHGTLSSLTAAQKNIVTHDNAFGFDLFARLADADTGGNLFVSPLSLSIALTMAYNGARGPTAAEMGAALGFAGESRDSVDGFYRDLLPALALADPNVSLKISNSIWTAPAFPLDTAFIGLNTKTFDAENRSLDFTAAGSADVINRWVSDKTNGLIPTLVNPPLDPESVMMLLNALYFKGNWSKPFDPKFTYDGVFHTAAGGEKACRMMSSSEGAFFYFQDEEARGVSLPYGDSLYSMVLLQPTDSAGMKGLIHALQGGAWARWQDRFAPSGITLQVPKFKLEYSASVKTELAAMGMGRAFSDSADFTGMGGNGMRVSDVFHKTFVNVDETGTEAAAATGVMMSGSLGPSEIIRFNRPFLCLIVEKFSDAILFLGRIDDPAP